jgi:hypothetical protein
MPRQFNLDEIPDAHGGDYSLMWSILRFLKSTLIEHRKKTAFHASVNGKSRVRRSAVRSK